jgi:ABC-type dipeptide/oligopeptide/nickel transport system permease component
MWRVIGKRILSALPNLVGVVVITFILTRALPGDPAAFFAGPAGTTEAIEQIRQKLGLDKSLPEQFLVYVKQLAKGDMGVRSTPGNQYLQKSFSVCQPLWN